MFGGAEINQGVLGRRKGRGGEGVKKDDHSLEEEAKRKKHHILFAHHWSRIEWLIGTLKALPLPFRMTHGELNNRVLATQGTEKASLRKSEYIPCR